MTSTNPVVSNALRATNRLGIIDYSRFKPQDKWEVLDDLETIGGNSPADIADLKRIKPYAQKYGCMADFEKHCAKIGAKV